MSTRGRKRHPAVLIIVLGLFLNVGTAGARIQKISDRIQNVWNCGADIVAHCADVKPGGDRVAECLLSKKRLITGMCSDRRTTPDHTPAVCKPDAARLCPENAGDSSIQLICLRMKKEQVSEKCWEKLERIGTHGFEVLPIQFKRMPVDSECTAMLLKHCGCRPVT